MKLIGSPTSPFVRKCRAFLLEKKLPYDFVIDVPWNADTQVPQFNPLGKVPVLVLNDNSTVYDSRVIVEYLDDLGNSPVLIPKSPQPRIAVKRWEVLADGVCDAAVVIFVERTKRPAAQQSADWITRHYNKIHAGLQAMSHELGSHNWCNGTDYSLADIAVGCCLGYLDLRFDDLDWRKPHPNLASLFDRIAQRSAFVETHPPS